MKLLLLAGARGNRWEGATSQAQAQAQAQSMERCTNSKKRTCGQHLEQENEEDSPVIIVRRSDRHRVSRGKGRARAQIWRSSSRLQSVLELAISSAEVRRHRYPAASITPLAPVPCLLLSLLSRLHHTQRKPIPTTYLTPNHIYTRRKHVTKTRNYRRRYRCRRRGLLPLQRRRRS
jgi:hypothetical protein